MTSDIQPLSTPHYHPATVILHWLMVLLLLATFATIQLHEVFPRGTDLRTLTKSAHFMLGVLALALVVVRILTRLGTPQPVPAEGPIWMQRAAQAGHFALYAWMVVLPILGWASLSAAGKPIPFFGLELPPLLGLDKPLARDLKKVHEAVGEFGYWLIGLHAAAALVHHFVLKDGLMKRMTLHSRD